MPCTTPLDVLKTFFVWVQVLKGITGVNVLHRLAFYMVQVCRAVSMISGVTRIGVTRGGNWGLSPLLFPENTDDLFKSSPSVCLSVRECHPYLLSPEKWTTFFAHHCHFYCFTRVSPHLEGVTRTFFLPVRPRLSTVLCEFIHNFFFIWMSPPGGCHPGWSAPPPSDSTVNDQWEIFCVFLQCFDTVGWVIWPVKTRPRYDL